MGLTSSAVEKFADLARGRMEAMAGEERDEEEEAEDASILRRTNLESVVWAISHSLCLSLHENLFCFFFFCSG